MRNCTIFQSCFYEKFVHDFAFKKLLVYSQSIYFKCILYIFLHSYIHIRDYYIVIDNYILVFVKI